MTCDELNRWLTIREFPKASLAARLNVSRMTIYRWCSGQSPLPDDLQAQLDALNLAPLPPAPTKTRRVWVPELGRRMRRRVRESRVAYWSSMTPK